MNPILKVAAPYLIGAGILAAVAVGVRMYGGHQYRAGLAAERAATLERQARVERAMQEERDRADAQYRGAVLAREAAQRDLSGVRARLDRLLSEQAGRRPEAARAGGRSDGAGADWIGGFAACYAAYGDLAADAARWADQVNGLQGFIRGVRP
ncbi:hypothetical protein [Bordetella bronchiseptica]|uniref:hypothetical protein n=1 Tax=Bordetella bronchiseptica TaxID=518 RepID=UPI0009BF4409|nr:hypothetical protein [Bordetella bronchiseptica]